MSKNRRIRVVLTKDDENVAVGWALPTTKAEDGGQCPPYTGLTGERLLIIGLGNPLMGDDGAGIQVVNELLKLALPENVDVIDGGTPGVGLIDMMSGYSRVIVVDAVMVEGGTSPCEVYLTTLKSPLSLRDRVRVGLTSDDNCSLHEMELTSVLKLMQSLGMSIPEITIIGIPAVNIAPGIGLSEECMRLIPETVKLITEAALNREGHCHDIFR